jgi:hypothetical protein
MAERNSYLDLNELIIFASAKLSVTSTWVICMIDKLKSDVLVFSSNPCFHQNKKQQQIKELFSLNKAKIT